MGLALVVMLRARIGVAQPVAPSPPSAVVRGWAAAPTAAVKIHAVSGVLRVRGWARDSIHLTAVVARGESVFGGGTRTAHKLGLEGQPVTGTTDATVLVPLGATVVVRSGAAAVEVHGVRGMVDVGAAAGSVLVRDAPAGVVVETVQGDVHVDAVTGSTRVRTIGGRVSLAGEVRDGSVSTVTGELVVSAGVASVLRVVTVDGALTLRPRLARGASLDAESFGGAVRLAASAAGATLDLRTVRGRISAADPPHQRVVTREGGATVLRMIAAPGSAAVSVRSLSGDIVLQGEGGAAPSSPGSRARPAPRAPHH